ncbi:MAG: FitA-like ribbon-helix-helix domain-containing protein [Kiritimatiellia bacterium]|jgi:plasmid stability protein
MKSIHIRAVDDLTMEGLKRRARRHHRSLQKEVEALLRDAAQMMPSEEVVPQSVLDGLRTVATCRQDSAWSRESMYDDDGR